jgi:hypothetical protein
MEKNMKNLVKLIKDNKKEAKSAFAIENDMVDMYNEDAADQQKVLDLLSANEIIKARKKLQYMDTSPREDTVMAIFADKGAEYVETLGWTINN